MDKTTRYLLLFFGFIAFLIIAPMLVLYISGHSFDFTDRSYTPTGILSIDSEPTGAKVFLNGQEIGSTPLSSRFINQGQYSLEIKKDGYFDWQQNIFVEKGKVTYPHDTDLPIKLFAYNLPLNLGKDNIKDFIYQNNTVIGLTNKQSIKVLDANTGNGLKEINLPKNAIQIHALNQKYAQIILEKNQTALLNLETWELKNLPILLGKNIKILSDSNSILATKEKSLVVYNLVNSKETILQQGVLGFDIFGNDIYIATNTAPGLISYTWNGSSLINPQIIYKETLPMSNEVVLLTTTGKSLYILNNKSLFKVETKLNEISTDASQAQVSGNIIWWRTPTEISYFSDNSSIASLLTRTGQNIFDTHINTEIGYSFLATINGLEIIENYNNGGQNKYLLEKNSEVYKLQFDESNKNLFYLTKNQIKKLRLVTD